ncbi:MAG: hypothetical protein J5685_01430 [Clostridiales bacterium]|nr:hypothetical protein [Clostridiales bacterium]
MSNDTGDEKKIAALPKEGVHCFPANAKQIGTRRIVTVILSVVFIALIVIGFVMDPRNYILCAIGTVGLVISVLVLAQTFLIAKYRVAIDYNEKKVVLRYRFSNISIPFESFDSYEGEGDKAEELLENSGLGERGVQYLVLDNVFDEACFQTSTKDLASTEDFLKLKAEAVAIADAYGARNSEGAIKITYGKMAKASNTKEVDGDDVDSIVDAAMSDDDKAEIAKEVADTAEEAVEEAAIEVSEASEDTDSEEKA